MIDRRGFIKGVCATLLAKDALAWDFLSKSRAVPGREALHYDRIADGKNSVACRLCPRRCRLSNGELSFCRARKNIDGTLYALGFGLACAVHIDPIEKKPFYNYYPQSRSFSIASAGCNLRCKFCQNWHISQISPPDAQNSQLPPTQIVAASQVNGCRSIAYTYSEPSIFFEYMLETAREARSRGVLNVYHSNGFINQEPLKELCRYLDAANIDLKGFSDEYYREMSEAWLEPILETLKTLKKEGVWLEITTLLVPGLNDDPVVISKMAAWIRENLGAETPLHFSRFFPLHKLTHLPPTPIESLDKARAAARKMGLKFVYIGNVPGHEANNTFCPKCSRIVVKRVGFSVQDLKIKDGKCHYCREPIQGNWTLPI